MRRCLGISLSLLLPALSTRAQVIDLGGSFVSTATANTPPDRARPRRA